MGARAPARGTRAGALAGTRGAAAARAPALALRPAKVMAVLDEISAPIVLAPLGGGPSTPELAAAVSDAGGFGFLAGSYLTADALAERVAATRELTGQAFGVNVFSPVPGPAEPESYSAYARRVREWAGDRGFELGEPRFGDDDYQAKLDLQERQPVSVVSFTFGCPSREVVDRLHRAGSEVWVTVTNPREADQAMAVGADALIAQGVEAGGHRASFADDSETPTFALLPLLQLITARHPAPVVASGGIATGGGIAAALAAGASAAQLGTAFMLCPEAGTSAPHRAAIASSVRTAQTRAFSGRTARGIENDFMAAHSAAAPAAYPEIHYLTAPMRQAARSSGDESAINLWAGEAHELARAVPAGQLVRELVAEAREAARHVAGHLR
jgi:nitronate monooxygenase